MGSLHPAVSFHQLFNMKSMILSPSSWLLPPLLPLPRRSTQSTWGNNPRTTTQRNRSTLSATRLRTASPSARAESRSRSEISPKKPEPSPRANTLTPKTAGPTPSHGPPMRTVSRPPETICPLPHPCPSTSSRCSLTWLPPENCKLNELDHGQLFEIMVE